MFLCIFHWTIFALALITNKYFVAGAFFICVGLLVLFLKGHDCYENCPEHSAKAVGLY